MKRASALALIGLGALALAADPELGSLTPWLAGSLPPGPVSAPAPSGEGPRGNPATVDPEQEAADAAAALDLEARRAALSVLEADIAAKLEELKELERRALEAVEGRAAEAESEHQSAAEAETADVKKVVSLCESMKPKNAARLLENLPIATATSVLRAMKARPAGKILNELDPKLGARISERIAEPGK